MSEHWKAMPPDFWKAVAKILVGLFIALAVCGVIGGGWGVVLALVSVGIAVFAYSSTYDRYRAPVEREIQRKDKERRLKAAETNTPNNTGLLSSQEREDIEAELDRARGVNTKGVIPAIRHLKRARMASEQSRQSTDQRRQMLRQLEVISDKWERLKKKEQTLRERDEQERRYHEDQSRPQPDNANDYLEDYYRTKPTNTPSLVPHLTKGRGTEQRDRFIERLSEEVDRLEQLYLTVSKGSGTAWSKQSWDTGRGQIDAALRAWDEDTSTLDAYFNELQRQRAEQKRLAAQERQVQEEEEELRRRRQRRGQT